MRKFVLDLFGSGAGGDEGGLRWDEETVERVIEAGRELDMLVEQAQQDDGGDLADRRATLKVPGGAGAEGGRWSLGMGLSDNGSSDTESDGGGDGVGDPTRRSRRDLPVKVLKPLLTVRGFLLS